MEISFLKGSFERRTEGAALRMKPAPTNGLGIEQGPRVGTCFKVHAADGTAWYQVTSVSPTSAEVEWRDYGIDRTMDEMLGAGGMFPLRVIERLVRHHDTLEELFGGSDPPLLAEARATKPRFWLSDRQPRTEWHLHYLRSLKDPSDGHR
jgi:hypothetical protein